MAEGQWASVGTTRLAWTVRLFRAGGVDVRFHWPWLWLPLVLPPAVRPGDYSSWPWYVAEAVVLAGLLLLHEAGHALACRLVGGRPARIALWGGGGLTEMELPLRPGAWLAVMLAGPAVNGLLALAALALP